MSIALMNPSEMTKPSHLLTEPSVEKSRWLVSFCVAAAFHGALFFISANGFIQMPEYGIEGTMASMEISMVAARPESSNEPIPQKQAESHKPKLLRGEITEMAIATPVEEPVTAKNNTTKQPQKKNVTNNKSAEEKSPYKGDGSSAIPGKSSTTFFSVGSTETFGKSGKYRNSPPVYPMEAQRNGWEGVVLLKALIEKEGKPSQVVLAQSSGYAVLDNAALNKVKHWKFVPGRFGNMTVSTWIEIPIRFTLGKTPQAGA